MSGILALLIWLICILISATLIIYFLNKIQQPLEKEGFTMHVCPAGSMSYITRDGDTECCNGDIMDDWCNGTTVCSLSPKNKKKLPTCGQLAKSNLAKASANLCPTAIPNYFASLDGSLRGCSVSQPLPNGIGPSDPNQLQCILYPTPELDKIKLDSCYNYGLKQSSQSVQCPPSSGNIQSATNPAGFIQASANPTAYIQAPASPTAYVQAPASPTAYVMFGDDIVGELPVSNTFSGKNFFKDTNVHVAQDGQDTNFAFTDINNNSRDGFGYKFLDLSASSITDEASFINRIGAGRNPKVKEKKYKIKRSDGTR